MGKLLFIQNKDTQLLGPMYISAQAKKLGHEVRLILNQGDYLKKINEINPDLIGFSAMSVDVNWVLKTAGEIKSSGIKTSIIVGGAHTILFPELVEEPVVDIICYTEGETIIPMLLDCIKEKKEFYDIPGLWWKDAKGCIIKNERSRLNDNLDEYPFADRELYSEIRKENSRTARILASRGCTCRCSFCEMPAILDDNRGYGKPYRLRSKENIIAEIKELMARGARYIVFTDSTLNLNPKWFKGLLEDYSKEVKLPFSCNIRIDLLDEETGQLLHAANCMDVRIGVETGDEELRRRVLNKEISNNKLLKGVEILRKYKIKIITYNMFCLPDEDISKSWETIRLNRKINPYVVCTMIYLPFKKTRLYDYALKDCIVPEDMHSKLALQSYRSILKLKDKRQMSNLHKFSILAIRHPILVPLIKLLIKLPENKLYDAIYILTERVEMRHWKKESLKETLKDALINIRKL